MAVGAKLVLKMTPIATSMKLIAVKREIATAIASSDHWMDILHDLPRAKENRGGCASSLRYLESVLIGVEIKFGWMRGRKESVSACWPRGEND